MQIKATTSARDWQRPNCFGCGLDNPHSLKANFLFDEDSAEVRFEHKAQGFEHGAPGYVHGGALATILDEAQGALCHHLGYLIMTDELHTKYHKAVAIDEKFKVRAWLTLKRKRRLYTNASIHNLQGELLVSCKASWYLLPERTTNKLFKGIIKEEEINLIKGQLELNKKRAQARVQTRAKKFKKKLATKKTKI